MGDGVNIAARSKASPSRAGSTFPTTPTGRSRVGSISQSPILARYQLKNIAEPIRVYSLRVGVPAQAKPAMPHPRGPRPSRRKGVRRLLPFAAALSTHRLS